MKHLLFWLALLDVLIINVFCEDQDWICNPRIAKTVKDVHLRGHYDLCDFVLTEDQPWGYYYVYDDRVLDGDASNYTYYFNIANVIQARIPDDECYNVTIRENANLPIGYCPNEKMMKINESDAESAYKCGDNDNKQQKITQPAAAYQVYRGNNRENRPCWRLHDGETEPVWTFYDNSDPALGVTLTYTTGDWCSSQGINREFRINFLCDDDITNVPDAEETIFEPEPCLYEFSMKTTKGCPVECEVVEDKLCNGKGICDFDWSTKFPKCFCYYGYYGKDCTLTEDPALEVVYEDSDNSYVGALVVVILLLMVILFILGYLFIRYSRLGKGYIDNYKSFKPKKKRKKVAQDEYDDE